MPDNELNRFNTVPSEGEVDHLLFDQPLVALTANYHAFSFVV